MLPLASGEAFHEQARDLPRGVGSDENANASRVRVSKRHKRRTRHDEPVAPDSTRLRDERHASIT
jgi:hypothetical protein